MHFEIWVIYLEGQKAISIKRMYCLTQQFHFLDIIRYTFKYEK